MPVRVSLAHSWDQTLEKTELRPGICIPTFHAPNKKKIMMLTVKPFHFGMHLKFFLPFM